ncbi:MAG: cobaltochelatase subunit CobN, partial [Algicola sp.]|nr:cobaltochelatase subunit CobN [Algicola sp.]
KATKVVALKHTANKDKKLTVMVWGNRDVGASFMNIPESLGAISARLNQADYQIPAVKSDYFTRRIDRILNPFYRSYELEPLIKDDLAELMPVNDYLSWFNSLPAKVREPINSYWGQAKDNFMVINRDGQAYFVLPRIRVGNMLVMRQPPRADNNEEDQRIYHKGTIPMNHYYLAAYYYARQYWGSDAIIHLGTHGSHEYLPGKERGLSVYDQGNLAVWDTPVVYPFIVDDVGEAMQTKRRGNATVISHMTPPFAAAGLQGEVANIHELMHQYKSLDTGGVKTKTGEQIVESCISNNICTDLNLDRATIDADFDGFIDTLHQYLESLATQNQPLGLHTFGQLAEKRLLASTIVQMLGSEFTTLAATVEQSSRELNGEDFTNNIGYKTVWQYVINNGDTSQISEPMRGFVEQGRLHYQNISEISELDNLMRFLQSGYIPVKNGGDPIRNPASLPTGLNLYGFDPSRVPTKAAYEQGKELTEQLIADYYKNHKKYPDKLAFSLWSMETMRHYGVLESQVLYAMGVKPKWSPDGRVIGTEIIQASELKRPRVDVVLSATGLYRDAFPNVMQWMAKAIAQVVALKEANNSLWDNGQKVKAALVEQGVEAVEAEYLSTVRIFSNESGNYGSGIGDAAMASDTWEADSKLADLYLSRMGYFYGADNKRWGQKAPPGIDLYAAQLSGSDIAVFSRSSNVYGMLSSDDPFQYFGGLALAIRNIDGKSPQMYISNLRDAKQGKAENAAIFLAKELRTRSLHPRWIKHMMKEGYSGAVSMAGNVNNFFGWQVVDPALVRGDQWQSLFDVYIKDQHELGLDEWFEQVDAKAQAAIIERMLEATRKDYWQANDATVQTLVERYQQLVNQFDLVVDNEKLREFVTGKAEGFGLNLTLPAPQTPGAVLPMPNKVEGQQLEKIERVEAEVAPDQPLYWVLLACLLLMGFGAFRQHRDTPMPV